MKKRILLILLTIASIFQTQLPAESLAAGSVANKLDEAGFDADGPYGLQVASYSVLENVAKGWDILRRRHPELQQHSACLVQVELPDLGTMYRLVIGPFTDRSQAVALQRSLANQGQDTALRRFSKVTPVADLQKSAGDKDTTDSVVTIPSAPPAEKKRKDLSLDLPTSVPATLRVKGNAKTGKIDHSVELKTANATITQSLTMSVYDTPDGETGEIGEFDPKAEKTTVSVKSALSPKVRSEVGLVQNLDPESETPDQTVYGSLSWDLDDFTLEPRVDVQSDGSVSPYAGIKIPF